ncbi:hypothetical protein V3C40_28270 [Janthinobacterium sp. LS2A]|uniref:hypothetical protein n=1 Tax=Janthinobacterium sp. LS2A TaxID=3118590 RepID=UPI002F9338D2
MSIKSHQWLPYCCIFLLWLAAVYLGNHSGLALMVDINTGEKHCVEMLALHFQAIQYSELLGLLGSASVIGVFLLPAIAIFVGIIDFRSRQRRKVQQAERQ